MTLYLWRLPTDPEKWACLARWRRLRGPPEWRIYIAGDSFALGSATSGTPDEGVLDRAEGRLREAGIEWPLRYGDLRAVITDGIARVKSGGMTIDVPDVQGFSWRDPERGEYGARWEAALDRAWARSEVMP